MVKADVDFDKPGRHFGTLTIPYSHDLGGWARLTVPIVVMNAPPSATGGAADTEDRPRRLSENDTPTVLVLGGNHGDEYEGPIAISHLVRHLTVDEMIHGRLIFIPCLSMEAAKNGTRLWPDGTNFNRSFPGLADGTPAEQLAHFLSQHLFPMADVVIDTHSGGYGTQVRRRVEGPVRVQLRVCS